MNFFQVSSELININKEIRRLILLILDFLLLVLSSFLSFSLLNLEFSLLGLFDRVALLLISPALGIFIYALLGQYKSLTRFVDGSYLYVLTFRNFLFILTTFLFLASSKIDLPPSYYFLFFLFSSCFTGLIRLFIKDFLTFLQKNDLNYSKRIAIYGAGSAGYQLINNLKGSSSSYKISFFVDDDPSLWGCYIGGKKIISPDLLVKNKNEIDQVFIAIPSLSPKNKRVILNKLIKENFEILIIPSIFEITQGRAPIESVRPILIEDLLSRNSVTADPKLLGPGIKNRSFCVTGAGGSIGSEICRQIIYLKPKRLVLFEFSELNLYSIHNELLNISKGSIEIIPVLGNVSNSVLLENTILNNKVEVIFHAAAYKHVPIVELNPLEGIFNNIYTTKVICEVAEKLSLKEVILLSSDKAVRPTSVMGATKRVSELIIQAYADKKSSFTKYSMVRFGNVLGSSGSVVPLFKEQIQKGGPISITHKEVTRFFMTIPEAAQLVLQASVLSKGGDIFLLDMGEPVKILNLAEQMISLSGKKVKRKKNQVGDIEINYIGLRPGEKLYEELLIDTKSEKTSHPLIFRAKEKFIPYENLIRKLNLLEKSLTAANIEETYTFLKQLVPEWNKKI